MAVSVLYIHKRRRFDGQLPTCAHQNIWNANVCNQPQCSDIQMTCHLYLGIIVSLQRHSHSALSTASTLSVYYPYRSFANIECIPLWISSNMYSRFPREATSILTCAFYGFAHLHHACDTVDLVKTICLTVPGSSGYLRLAELLIDLIARDLARTAL